MRDYKKEIKELKMVTEAENRIMNYGISKNYPFILNYKISNTKNLIIILISFIPILPKLIFLLKDFLFKLRWL